MSFALSLLPIAILAAAAWRDLATRLIPDVLPILLVLIGLALRGRGGLAAAGMSLGIAVVLFLLLALLHGRGLLGGGDVKLAAGVAAGLAPQAALSFVIMTGFAGAVLALLHLATRTLPLPPVARASRRTLPRVWRAERWRIARHGPLPYGVAIACGGAWAIFHSLGA